MMISKIKESLKFRITLVLDRIFCIIELLFLPRKKINSSNFVFILGAPRVGSTFTFDLLVKALPFHYHTNLRMIFPTSALGKFLEKRYIDIHGKEYKGENHHGYISHPMAPSEAFRFWRYIFPRKIFGDDVVNKKLSRNKKILFEKIVSDFNGEAHGRPILVKNLEMSLRMIPLTAEMKDSCFIIILRKPSDIMESILKARSSVMGSPTKYWSMRPSSYRNDLRSDIKIQIENQVLGVYSELLEFYRHHKNFKFYYVWYEEICDNPDQLINWANCKFFKNNNLNMNFNNLFIRRDKVYSYDWNNSKILELMDEIEKLDNGVSIYK